MKRIYCLALVMSLAVGCQSDDASEGTTVAEEQPGGGASPISTPQAGVPVEGCAQSDSCSQFGLCTESIDGSRCIVTDESCRQSLACSGQGLCVASFDLDSCVATEEGCARSAACTEVGLCGLNSDELACALTSGGCAESTACAEESLCSLSSDGSACVDIRDFLEWVRIEGGSFMMGSTEAAFPHETTPVHSVTVTPFEITATEVTVAQYRACVYVGRCSEPSGIYSSCSNWNVEGRENHPISCVDWGQARTFAKWVGADVDLPTEAEWEYAARGGQDFIYAGSNDLNEVAWYDGNSANLTKPVGTKQANGYGLYDMSGNVEEWVLDERHENYEGAPTVSNEAWGEVLECGQVCDIGSAWRAIRGGSYFYPDDLLRIDQRHNDSPDARRPYLGFRLRRTR